MLRKFQVTSVSNGNYYALLFHDSGFPLFKYLQSFFWFRIVLAEYFYSFLCFIWFSRYSMIKFAWDGSSHFMMSMHTLFPFIKQMSRLNNSFNSGGCPWSFGCRLSFIYSVVRWLIRKSTYSSFIFTLLYLCLVSRLLEFTRETLPKFTKIFNT